MLTDRKICWEILPKVSRSFSLCIKILPKPLDEHMMLSYMIFRIIDTIEDASVPLTIKKQGFDKFLKVIGKDSYHEGYTQDCKKFLLSKLTYTYEQDLLENMASVIRVYYDIGTNQRKAIFRWGTEMASGMYDFQTKKILTFKDQDDYSYYVAGVVGYLFNDLFYYNKVITKSKRDHLMEYAKQYGLGLQKVNILRDVAYDIPQNRLYWPENIIKKQHLDYSTLCLEKNRKNAMEILKIMIDNALGYLNNGLYYCMALPKTSLKVRVFCLIPLFMAIESFTKCFGNEHVFIKGKKVKISRIHVKRIVKKSYLYSVSNTLLKKWYNGLMKEKYKEPTH